MLIGIYNSAFLISINKSILETIYKHLTQSKLLGIIGQAEKIKEMNKIVKNIVNNVAADENNCPKIEKIQSLELKYRKILKCP